MAIQLSPSVLVQEKDLTNVIPAVTASIGAAVIDAVWGPVSQVTAISSENELLKRFGKPDSQYADNWLTVANFLAYSSAAMVVRTDNANQLNATSLVGKRVTSITSTNSGYTTAPTVVLSAPTSGQTATATAAIDPANPGKILITVTNGGSGYTVAPTATITKTTTGDTITAGTTTVNVGDGGIKIQNNDVYTTMHMNGNNGVGAFAARYPGKLGNAIRIEVADATNYDSWANKAYFSAAPGTSEYADRIKPGVNDEMHILVIDSTGAWTGTSGAVLEAYPFASKAQDAKFADGSTAYYKNVINAASKYVYWMDHPTDLTSASTDAAWGTGVTDMLSTQTRYKTFTSTQIYTSQLTMGADDCASTDANKIAAYDLFARADELDINLVMAGKASQTLARHIINNVAEVRKDCIAFISPGELATGNKLSGPNSEIVTNLIKFKNITGAPLPSSSYVVYDSGHKYQYDRYNDLYRWLPLNGDIAGLCARADYTNDPWYSPAGLNRGHVKNVVKLAISPNSPERDMLYTAGINPVVAFPGQGVVLFGDKTGLSKPSAFDRINVRRLFITLEKAISTAAKYQLFEFNDSFTRAQFKNIVEPYLRDVKGRRGITDFMVVVDESNNTSEVIDSNRFVADIYIKPARSINFIQLNFVATRSGAAFTEIAG